MSRFSPNVSTSTDFRRASLTLHDHITNWLPKRKPGHSYARRPSIDQMKAITKNYVPIETTHSPEEGPDQQIQASYGQALIIEVLDVQLRKPRDSFVTLRFGQELKSTHVIRSSACPKYYERFVFWISSSPSTQVDDDDASLGQILHLSVCNRKVLCPNVTLARVEMNLETTLSLDESIARTSVALEKEVREMHLALRRMHVRSRGQLEAIETLARSPGSISGNDLVNFGRTVPQLWKDFEPAVDVKQVKMVKDNHRWPIVGRVKHMWKARALRGEYEGQHTSHVL